MNLERRENKIRARCQEAMFARVKIEFSLRFYNLREYFKDRIMIVKLRDLEKISFHLYFSDAGILRGDPFVCHVTGAQNFNILCFSVGRLIKYRWSNVLF